MAFYQQALKTLIDTKLNVNTQGIVFDTVLYSEIADDNFGETTNVTNTYKVETKRKVPTIIASINGEYVPIPNVTATNNSVELLFDLAVDDMTGLPNEDEFQTVDYNDTLSAIDEFRASILANYFPLGTHYLMFGGEDSTMTGVMGTAISPITIRTTLIPLDNEIETIFSNGGVTLGKFKKTATHYSFFYEGASTIEIPYTVGVESTIEIYFDTNRWYITDGANTDSAVSTQVHTYASINFGYATGLYAKLKSFKMTVNSHESIADEEIDISDFTDKTTVVNNGAYSIDFTALNCVLWGSDGNAVFQVYPLMPVGQYKATNGINYHSFSLQLESLVSEDVLFGNNFEYFLDDIQIYPVDRDHTLGTDLGSAQKINDNYNKHLVEESSREHSMSFYYIPTKQLTSLLKHIVSGSVAQNTIYELKVQYPFFNVTYDVVIENGGTKPNINSMSTFTITFKRKSDFLT